MNVKTKDDVKRIGLFKTDKFDSIMAITSDIISAHQKEFNERNIDISDTPISPMNLDDDYTPILLTDTVAKTIENIVDLINHPETSYEYSFVLLGKTANLSGEKCYKIDKIIDCTLMDTELSKRETKVDNEKLNDIINRAMKEGYDFISIGHTHPNISLEERKLTIANYLPNDVIAKEYIREAGLNLSLQDIISYESIYDYFKNKPHIKVFETVIMYNGEITLFYKDNNELKRMTVIMNMSTAEEIYVSNKSDYNNLKK